MKRMMRGLLLVVLMSFSLYAERLPDGGPYKELYNGWLFTFMVTNGCAELTNDEYAAVQSQGGKCPVIVPSVLGGCPVKSIGKKSFYLCKNITAVSIPESVTNIGEYAFYECQSLQSLVIPSNVVEIGSQAFFDCYSLSAVSLPNELKIIGSEAFRRCISLQRLIIPSGVSEIRAWAFFESGIQSLTIPASVDSVGYHALQNLNSGPKGKVDLYFEGAPPHGIEEAADDSTAGIWRTFVHYNDDYIISWKAIMDYDWYFMFGIPYDPYAKHNPATEVVGAAEWTFVTKDSCAEVGDGTAASALPAGYEGVAIIPQRLGGCPVRSACRYAFFDCDGITSATIPQGMTEIPDGLFYGCDGLSSVTIASSVTNIGQNAFYGCYNLAALIFEGEPPGGLADAWIESEIKIWCDAKYEAKWLDELETCCLFNEVETYVPEMDGVPEISSADIARWVECELASKFAKEGEEATAYCQRFCTAFTNDFGVAFLMKTGKFAMDGTALCVWHDYVAGTDPLDITSRFKAFVTIEDGKPIISWDPALNGESVRRGVRIYRVFGSESVDGHWVEVPEGGECDYDFFKVTVEMP